MVRTDRSSRRFRRAVPTLALLLGSLMAALAAPAVRAAEEPRKAVEPSADGRALLERYSAEGLTDSVLLRPRAQGSAVRSIEIAESGDVLVNGKEFDEDELISFLGDDGRRVAELSRLDFEELRAAFGLAATGLPEAPEAPEPPEAPDAEVSVSVPPVPLPPFVHVKVSRDDRVSVGHSIHIAEDESAHDVVCVGCSIELDGEAFGDVVAVGGSISVKGTAHGDTVSIGGSVDVADDAEVQGEAVAIGGGVEVAEGGKVIGRRSSVGVGDSFLRGWGSGWAFPFGVFSDVSRLLAAILRTGLLALFGVLCFLALRPAVERAARRATEEPWKAVFAGLLVQLLFLPVLVLVTVILAVSIVGIPLLALVPVALLAFVIASLVGFVGVGRAVGRWVEGRTGGRFTSEILAVVVGILVIQASSLIGRALSLPGGWFAAAGFAIVCFGFLAKYVAWTIGMGAMTLAAFGRDWRRPAPAPLTEPPAEEPPALPPPPPPPAAPEP